MRPDVRFRLRSLVATVGDEMAKSPPARLFV